LQVVKEHYEKVYKMSTDRELHSKSDRHATLSEFQSRVSKEIDSSITNLIMVDQVQGEAVRGAGKGLSLPSFPPKYFPCGSRAVQHHTSWGPGGGVRSPYLLL
jgi:hypothetical protein